jgi:hypothetical protein
MVYKREYGYVGILFKSRRILAKQGVVSFGFVYIPECREVPNGRGLDNRVGGLSNGEVGLRITPWLIALLSLFSHSLMLAMASEWRDRGLVATRRIRCGFAGLDSVIGVNTRLCSEITMWEIQLPE